MVRTQLLTNKIGKGLIAVASVAVIRVSRPSLMLLETCHSYRLWYTPLFSALQEAKAGGSLRSCPDYMMRPCLKTVYKQPMIECLMGKSEIPFKV